MLDASELTAVEFGFHGLGVLGSEIKHKGTAFQRAVVVVGAHASVVEVGEAGTAEVPHADAVLLIGCGSHLLSVGIHWHHSHRIVVCGFQSRNIGSPVGAVVADQLIVYLREVCILATFHIHVVG